MDRSSFVDNLKELFSLLFQNGVNSEVEDVVIDFLIDALENNQFDYFNSKEFYNIIFLLEYYKNELSTYACRLLEEIKLKSARKNYFSLENVEHKSISCECERKEQKKNMPRFTEVNGKKLSLQPGQFGRVKAIETRNGDEVEVYYEVDSTGQAIREIEVKVRALEGFKDFNQIYIYF